MQKILYILTKSDIGGAQKYVKDLAENLDKEKFETKTLYGGNPARNSPPQRPSGRESAGGISSGIKWLSNKTYPWFLFLNDWLAVFEIAKILNREQPNIIHLNSSKAGVIGALAVKIYKLRLMFGSPMSRSWTSDIPRGSTSQILSPIRKEVKPHKIEENSIWRGRTSDANKNQYLGSPTSKMSDVPKVVFTAHGWVFNHTNELNWLVRNFYIFLHKIAALFTDKIICVSEYDYNLAVEYGICQPEKLAMVHNGIDTNIKFLNQKEARNNITLKIKTIVIPGLTRNPENWIPAFAGMTEKIKLNDKWPWVGSIGRLVKEKNYETFIKAAKLIPNIYFFIIGEGPEKKNLESRIQNLELGNRFFIIPPTGNDAIYLKAFDIFVMSSIKEGLPYLVLEAMAAELPIVITEAGGMPELIKNHENGLMVAQKNPEAMANAINGLLKNPAITKELAKKAKEIVAEKFSLKKMIQKTEAVYLKFNIILDSRFRLPAQGRRE